MRKAAAPKTGGEMMAPRPPAASRPPAAFFSKPAFASIGQATVPIITVVATPEPEGPPSRKDDATTERPALDGLLPITASEKSMKNFPAPECCRMAP